MSLYLSPELLDLQFKNAFFFFFFYYEYMGANDPNRVANFGPLGHGWQGLQSKSL